MGKAAKASFSDPSVFPRTKSHLLFSHLRTQIGIRATALLSRQTANKDYQSSRVVLGEFLSECRHFAFNAVENSRLNPFVGLCHLVEVRPFVPGCINAGTMRTMQGKQ